MIVPSTRAYAPIGRSTRLEAATLVALSHTLYVPGRPAAVAASLTLRVGAREASEVAVVLRAGRERELQRRRSWRPRITYPRWHVKPQVAVRAHGVGVCRSGALGRTCARAAAAQTVDRAGIAVVARVAIVRAARRLPGARAVRALLSARARDGCAPDLARVGARRRARVHRDAAAALGLPGRALVGALRGARTIGAVRRCRRARDRLRPAHAPVALHRARHRAVAVVVHAGDVAERAPRSTRHGVEADDIVVTRPSKCTTDGVT